MAFEGSSPHPISARDVHHHSVKWDAESARRVLGSLPEALRSLLPEKRQGEFLAGRFCAARALERELEDFWVGRKESNRQPRWPKGFVGSITHTDGYAAAAVADASRAKSIGIDSENRNIPRDVEKLARRVFTAGDRRWLNVAELDRASIVLLISSAKESLFKALNPITQVYFGFHDAEFCGLGPGRFDIRLLKTIGHFSRGSVFSGSYSIEDDFIHTSIIIPTQ